jgi:hypothetical protein
MTVAYCVVARGEPEGMDQRLAGQTDQALSRLQSPPEVGDGKALVGEKMQAQCVNSARVMRRRGGSSSVQSLRCIERRDECD